MKTQSKLVIPHLYVQRRGKQQMRFGVRIYYFQPVASKTQGVRCDTLRFGRYKPLWGTSCFLLHCIYSTLKMDIAWTSEVVVSSRLHGVVPPKTVVSIGTAVRITSVTR